jgi:hypothetical protein
MAESMGPVVWDCQSVDSPFQCSEEVSAIRAPGLFRTLEFIGTSDNLV